MPQLKEDYSPRGNRARELFLQGYNCCQAVLLAFNDMTGLDDKSAARVRASAEVLACCVTFAARSPARVWPLD